MAARKKKKKKGKVFSLERMVDKQIARVLQRGQRFGDFDQIRQRHFWSTYLFPYGQNSIPAGQYDLFKATPSQTGQGYPTNVPLTLLETNWRNSGRVPDNQNLVITEIGCTPLRPGVVFNSKEDGSGIPVTAIYPNLPGRMTGADALGAPSVNPMRAIAPDDAARFLYGTVLEMSYLTNNVPLGLCADFSQSAGVHSFNAGVLEEWPPDVNDYLTAFGYTELGDPVNGVPAAAFRRKLEVPILLQHGETMGMRLNIHRDLNMLSTGGFIPADGTSPDQGGAGWIALRVDWWATESFVEYS
jgi:hypothetical protein